MKRLLGIRRVKRKVTLPLMEGETLSRYVDTLGG
jgi:hypothetical protein